VDPTAYLDDTYKSKFLTLPGLELRPSNVHSVASRCFQNINNNFIFNFRKGQGLISSLHPEQLPLSITSIRQKGFLPGGGVGGAST
jgi:hypothetical protein